MTSSPVLDKHDIGQKYGKVFFPSLPSSNNSINKETRNNIKLCEKVSTHFTKKTKQIQKNDVLIAEIPENEDKSNNQRIIEFASVITLIVNKQITTSRP